MGYQDFDWQNTPGINYATSRGATVAQDYDKTKVKTTSTFNSAPPPAAPDYATLRAIQQRVLRQGAIKDALKSYDEVEASTRATGFQTAQNAGNVYANRLMQSGVNPLASGVVAAQARLPVYKQLAEIGNEREKTRLDATNRADTLAASIAGNIANLQMSYSKMLADYNTQQTGFEVDLTKFNGAQDLGYAQLDRQRDQDDYARRAATIAATQNSSSGPIINAANTPGYIPNSGSIRPGTGTFAGNGNSVSVGWSDNATLADARRGRNASTIF